MRIGQKVRVTRDHGLTAQCVGTVAAVDRSSNFGLRPCHVKQNDRAPRRALVMVEFAEINGVAWPHYIKELERIDA